MTVVSFRPVPKLFVFLIVATLTSCGGRPNAHESTATPASNRVVMPAAPRLGGPLFVTADAQTWEFDYADLREGKTVTIAPLTPKNLGKLPVRIESVGAIKPSHVEVVGVYFADPNVTSPGDYEDFPPTADGKVQRILPLRQIQPIQPGRGVLVLIAARRTAGQHVGSIAGLQVRYRVGDTQYLARYQATTVLCAGNPARDVACLKAAANARKAFNG
jgi:hypothetical protein